MNAKQFMKGATFGAVLASVMTLLLAPQTGKRTRKEVTSLITTLAKQVHVRAAKVKKLSQSAYNDVVRQAVQDYAKNKKVAAGSYEDIVKILQSNWKEIKKALTHE
ncbi:YtxH domain-containing protein [Candidatus Uhrbacteria bacterium]|nr:YtxH domain-containing protein [Candidatus Uhrbacteria bacterium]